MHSYLGLSRESSCLPLATMGKRVAVVLAGCGVYDGSEIHESSAVLVHLSREGAQVRGAPAGPAPSPAPFALLCSAISLSLVEGICL